MKNIYAIDKSRELEFIRQVKCLKPEEIGANAYEQSYFFHLQLHLPYYIKIYSSLLQEAISRTHKLPAELSVLDYGAGNGLLGVYLKYMGIERVFVNDINESCLTSCKTLATAMSLDLDGYLHGDVLSLLQLGQTVDVLLSTDVLEHIYNPDQFFQHLKFVQPSMIAVFTTASNPFNRIKVQRLRKLQHRDEYINAADIWTSEENKFKTPFLQRRKELLAAEFPHLDAAEIQLLATKSRGMRRDDIYTLTTTYLQTGSLPEQSSDLFNTCDPDTGIWTERVLPIDYFHGIADKFGYKFQFVSGFYNDSGHSLWAVAKILANLIIKQSSWFGKFVAPYVVLFFVPDRKDK